MVLLTTDIHRFGGVVSRTERVLNRIERHKKTQACTSLLLLDSHWLNLCCQDFYGDGHVVDQLVFSRCYVHDRPFTRFIMLWMTIMEVTSTMNKLVFYRKTQADLIVMQDFCWDRHLEDQLVLDNVTFIIKLIILWTQVMNDIGYNKLVLFKRSFDGFELLKPNTPTESGEFIDYHMGCDHVGKGTSFSFSCRPRILGHFVL